MKSTTLHLGQFSIQGERLESFPYFGENAPTFSIQKQTKVSTSWKPVTHKEKDRFTRPYTHQKLIQRSWSATEDVFLSWGEENPPTFEEQHGYSEATITDKGCLRSVNADYFVKEFYPPASIKNPTSVEERGSARWLDLIYSESTKEPWIAHIRWSHLSLGVNEAEFIVMDEQKKTHLLRFSVLGFATSISLMPQEYDISPGKNWFSSIMLERQENFLYTGELQIKCCGVGQMKGVFMDLASGTSHSFQLENWDPFSLVTWIHPVAWRQDELVRLRRNQRLGRVVTDAAILGLQNLEVRFGDCLTGVLQSMPSMIQWSPPFAPVELEFYSQPSTIEGKREGPLEGSWMWEWLEEPMFNTKVVTSPTSLRLQTVDQKTTGMKRSGSSRGLLRVWNSEHQECTIPVIIHGE